MLRIILLSLIAPAIVFAAEQTIELKVSGNCKSCQKRIEKAARSVDGVDEAEWNKTTKILTVVFDDESTKKTDIIDAVLAVGYDVEDKTATDESYSKLPDCCQYRHRSHD